MKVGIIGEGDTEFYCIPTLVSKKGHQVVGCHNLRGVGGDYPWDSLFTKKIYPYVRGFAVKSAVNKPDKVLIIIDREDRSECCGGLAAEGVRLITHKLAEENLSIATSVVIPNRQIECWLMADTSALDRSPLFERPLSPLLGDNLDETNVMKVINDNLKKGQKWDKPKFGKALVQKLNLENETVLRRSRSLRKLIKEVEQCEKETE